MRLDISGADWEADTEKQRKPETHADTEKHQSAEPDKAAILEHIQSSEFPLLYADKNLKRHLSPFPRAGNKNIISHQPC